jgi:hypothetical protein
MALSLAAENVDRGEDAAVVALRFAMSLAKGQQR